MKIVTADTELTYIKGVGPKKAEILFKEIKALTVKDLLYYFPYKYTDRSRFYKINEIKTDSVYFQIKGKFCCFKEEGKPKKYLKARFTDETGTVEVIWFQGIKWIKQNIIPGKKYILYGKPKRFKNTFSFSHPDLTDAEQFNQTIGSPFVAEYSTTELMKKFYLNSKGIRKIIKEIFNQNIKLEEFIPQKILTELQYPEINSAIKTIHFPKNPTELKKAINRFKFEELFINQLSLLKQKKLRNNSVKGIVFDKAGDLFNDFYNNHLMFELTDAQKRVIREIYTDFRSGKQCNRLLQGDVGSGKTIVALMSMLIAVGNGYQTAMMAPTEILAQQHFQTIRELLDGMDVNVRLLTGSTKIAQRRFIDEELRNGSLNILVGTHALIEDKINFKKLGLVIIDEQHRFGVVQRAKLRQKNDGTPPHVIVMTATPIPRTLSMTLYGDLDVSIIDQMPKGRKPVKTYHLYDTDRQKLYSFIKQQIEKGHQIYIVYPLISESEKLDYQNLEEGYQGITDFFRPPKYKTVMVHGKMKPDEKQQQMDLFVKGEAQIMVATTVIEVGVNVPNATVMIIESAERFGLSQLHQLRGRVGRGSDQAYCILVTSRKLSAESRKRIDTMVRTTNGFEIAEVDMKLRGPGDMFGTQQSGRPLNFRIANLVTDGYILKIARQKAFELLDNDPGLTNIEHKNLARKVDSEIKNSFGNIG